MSQPSPDLSLAAIGYEESKRLARDADPAQRSELARRTDLKPEIIYYLACDGAEEVRRAVAANPNAPHQADLLLARDPDQAVREALAAKVACMVPDLDRAGRRRAERHITETLEVLSRDEAGRVRAILSDILREEAKAPPQVIQRLARDLDALVANPVLQFSPLLSESDLLEIVQAGFGDGRIAAISRRQGLGAHVADAIVDSDDREAITALLSNRSAMIREQTLNELVERATEVVDWHEPLVRRPRLPSGAAMKLATFVADHLVRRLKERKDLEPEAAARVSAELNRRLEKSGQAPCAEDPEQLEDELLKKALATGDRELARSRLATRSGLPLAAVDRILGSGSAKALTALAWKSGLDMLAALHLQLHLGGLTPATAIRPRPDGGFPLGTEEMTWQIEFFEGLA